MSITIDDMKMPKSCIACPFEHNGDCYGGKPKRIMDIEDFDYYRHPCCPLIDAEPVKHGHWIRTHFASPVWKCSVCRANYNRVSMIGANWCEACGAKMDEVEE